MVAGRAVGYRVGGNWGLKLSGAVSRSNHQVILARAWRGPHRRPGGPGEWRQRWPERNRLPIIAAIGAQLDAADPPISGERDPADEGWPKRQRVVIARDIDL